MAQLSQHLQSRTSPSMGEAGKGCGSGKIYWGPNSPTLPARGRVQIELAAL
jgi:hypothetical protein